MRSLMDGRCGPTWAVFRSSPAFCRLYTASLISQLGDGGMLIAFPLLIAQQTHDVTMAGLAFPGEILAFMLASPLAGWVADRLDQRATMVASDILRAGLLGVMLTMLHEGVGIWALILLSLLIGTASAFFQPARAAFLRRLLQGEAYAEAVTIEGTTHFLSRMIAPAAMGALLAIVPASTGIAVDMASFVVSAIVVLPLFRQETLVPTEHDDEEVDGDWREGWRAIGRSEALRWILPLDVTLCVTGMCSFGMIMAYLEQVAHVGAHHAGWLMAVAGGFGAVGTQLAPRWGQRRRAYLGAMAFYAVAYSLTGWGGSLSAIVIAWVLRGIGMGLLCTMISRRIAEEIPTAVMGRAQAAYDQVCCLAVVVGGSSAPFVLRVIGPASAFRALGLIITTFIVVAATAMALEREAAPAVSLSPAE